MSRMSASGKMIGDKQSRRAKCQSQRPRNNLLRKKKQQQEDKLNTCSAYRLKKTAAGCVQQASAQAVHVR